MNCAICGKYKPSDSNNWCEECTDKVIHGDGPRRPYSGKYTLIDVEELTRLRVLAEIGLAAVEKSQLPSLSDPDLASDQDPAEYLKRFEAMNRACNKIGELIDAYLKRGDK